MLRRTRALLDSRHQLVAGLVRTFFVKLNSPVLSGLERLLLTTAPSEVLYQAPMQVYKGESVWQQVPVRTPETCNLSDYSTNLGVDCLGLIDGGHAVPTNLQLLWNGYSRVVFRAAVSLMSVFKKGIKYFITVKRPSQLYKRLHFNCLTLVVIFL